MLKIAILGLGDRGRIYSTKFNTQDSKIVAICDLKEALATSVQQQLELKNDAVFLNDADFLSEKRGDILVVATQDRDHFRHAMRGLELGYHILLEKPVSPNYAECVALAARAKERNLTVVVCHVLRYSNYYDTIKRTIDSGAIGDIVCVQNTENVGFWHFSHSFVRGNWGVEAESAPSILAKCCHDLDMIYYLTGKKCTSVHSSATLMNFTEKTAPEGATDYCLAPCPHLKTCPYSAANLYYKFTLKTRPLMGLGWYRLITGSPKLNFKHFKETLKTSPYGRCVYKCNNDVMSEQVVNMALEDGVMAVHRMTAFSKDCCRKIHISGTKGEIIGCDKDGFFKLNIFGKWGKKIKINGNQIGGHLGGDSGIVRDFLQYMVNGTGSDKMTFIHETLESHKVAFGAEESRKTNKVITF
ncbi:MAG: Gfo/Idh/MocA family oxidoreductase [Bacillota bacterium]